jgi:hypothetical protein
MAVQISVLPSVAGGEGQDCMISTMVEAANGMPYRPACQGPLSYNLPSQLQLGECAFLIYHTPSNNVFMPDQRANQPMVSLIYLSSCTPWKESYKNCGVHR